MELAGLVGRLVLIVVRWWLWGWLVLVGRLVLTVVKWQIMGLVGLR